MADKVRPRRVAGGTVAGFRTYSMRWWVVRVGLSVLVWTVVMQLTSVAEVWHPRLRTSWPAAPCAEGRGSGAVSNSTDSGVRSGGGGGSGGDGGGGGGNNLSVLGDEHTLTGLQASPRSTIPRRVYRSNGYLKVSCNGGLNQMRAAICDMVTIARYLNLTLVVPELDKTSFWADSSNFEDIFDVNHFIDSLRDQVKIVKRIPNKFNKKNLSGLFSMPPVSWSNEKYYLKILHLIKKHKIIHFNKTDARLANNGLPLSLQKLRCRVNYEALKFTPHIEALGSKLISILREHGYFVVLHLRYEMDMLAFSGCTHGCSEMEANELTKMRYEYPWWKEKEIDSDTKRLEGLCPLTPEETALVLQALGFTKDTQIYIASGEIYGGERRLATLNAAYPKIVRKEMLLTAEELRPFLNHSTQMAALDYLVATAGDVFIPSYDGNMARVVEGHRRYKGFLVTISLDKRELVKLLDLLHDGSITWEQFSDAVKEVHKSRMGQPAMRKVLPGRPKEEDYFYANPHECLGHLNDPSSKARRGDI